MSASHEAVSRSDVSVGQHGATAERRADDRARAAERRMGLATRPVGAPAPKEDREMPAPAAVSRIGRTAGTPLSDSERTRYGGAFGHDFSRVRVHRGPEASAAADSIGACAFTLGSHVTLRDAYPGVLAHELGHVVENERGGDRPNVVRRIGVGEWFARLVGEGTYSDDELQIYLEKISKGKPEGTNESDDKARQVVGKGLHKQEDKLVRATMVTEMMEGFTGDDDENAILTILGDSPMPEREWIINKVGGMAALESEFQGAEFDKLETLLGGVARQRKAPVPLQWSARYTLHGEKIPAGTGVLLNSLSYDPEGVDDPTNQVANNEDLMLDPGDKKQLGEGPIDHPRAKGGTGFASVQVGPFDTENKVVTPLSDQAGWQLKTEKPYEPVEPTNKEMVADFDISIKQFEQGQKTQGVTKSDTLTNTNEKSMATTTGSEQSSETQQGVEIERSLKRKSEIKKWQRIGKNAEVERQKGHTDIKSESETKGEEKKKETTKSVEKVEGTEKSGATNTIKGGADFKGKFDAKLKGDIKKASKTWVTVGKMLLKLGKLAPGTYGRVFRLLGPIGDKILSFFEPGEDDLEIEFDADGNFELKGTFHAQSSIKAWREYQETHTINSKTEATTDTKSSTKGTATEDKIVDVTREGIQEEEGAEGSEGLEVGAARRDTKVEKQGTKKIESQTKGTKTTTSQTSATATSEGRTDRILVPIIESAKLTFRAE